jgi:hypothetical protein
MLKYSGLYMAWTTFKLPPGEKPPRGVANYYSRRIFGLRRRSCKKGRCKKGSIPPEKERKRLEKLIADIELTMSENPRKTLLIMAGPNGAGKGSVLEVMLLAYDINKRDFIDTDAETVKRRGTYNWKNYKATQAEIDAEKDEIIKDAQKSLVLKRF